MMAEAEKKRAMVEKVKELIRSRGGVYDPARGGWEFSNKKFVKHFNMEFVEQTFERIKRLTE